MNLCLTYQETHLSMSWADVFIVCRRLLTLDTLDIALFSDSDGLTIKTVPKVEGVSSSNITGTGLFN